MTGQIFPAPATYTVWTSSTLYDLVQATSEGATGPTGPTGPSGAAGATGPTGSSRSNANLQLQWVSGAVVTADTAWFCFKAPYNGTINSLTYFADTGSFTVEIEIAGTGVTGLTSVSVASATPATTNATALNTFTAGQAITAVVSSPSGSPTDALLSLSVTWS